MSPAPYPSGKYRYTHDEISSADINSNGVFIAHHYDFVTEPTVVIYTAPEGYYFMNLKNMTSQNTYIQAKTFGAGDDFTLISGGVWNPSSAIVGNWVDFGRGHEVYGNFSQVALKKPGVNTLRIAFALTLMERKD